MTSLSFPYNYPYKLRRVCKHKQTKRFYINSYGKQMIRSQLVEDVRLVVLIDHFFKISQKLKETTIRKIYIQQLILNENIDSYGANVTFNKLDNMHFYLIKEKKQILNLIRALNFTFYKRFTSSVLKTIRENKIY